MVETRRMRKRGRISGGRLEAWRAALAYLGKQRWFIAQGVGAVALRVVAINLPVVPGTAYARGGATAGLIVAFLWVLSWVAWVTSGLAFRIQGTFAEDAVTDTLRKSSSVFEVVPSLKFDKSDVDQVAICPSGILAVETKWHSYRPAVDQLAAEAYLAAAGARKVRGNLRSLQIRGLPGERVRAVLVVCGPGREGLPECWTVETTLGDVDVVNHGELDGWLAKHRSGPVGADFAQQLGAELHKLARWRDAAAVDAGPLLRWLARTG